MWMAILIPKLGFAELSPYEVSFCSWKFSDQPNPSRKLAQYKKGKSTHPHCKHNPKPTAYVNADPVPDAFPASP